MLPLSSLEEFIWNLSFFSFKYFVEFTGEASYAWSFLCERSLITDAIFKTNEAIYAFYLFCVSFIFQRNCSLFSKSLNLGAMELTAAL